MSAISWVASLIIFFPGDGGALPFSLLVVPTDLILFEDSANGFVFSFCFVTYSSSLDCTSCRTLPGEASLTPLSTGGRCDRETYEFSLLRGRRCLALRMGRPDPWPPAWRGECLPLALWVGVDRPEEARDPCLELLLEACLEFVGVDQVLLFLLASSFALCSMT